MAGNRTLAIIKPDAVASGKSGAILAHLEREGFVVRAARLLRLSRLRPAPSTKCTAGARSTASWSSFMTSGPCLPLALERADAVARSAPSSAPPTRPRRPRARSGSCTRSPRDGTRCTDRTAMRTPRGRSRSSFPRANWPTSPRAHRNWPRDLTQVVVAITLTGYASG